MKMLTNVDRAVFSIEAANRMQMVCRLHDHIFHLESLSVHRAGLCRKDAWPTWQHTTSESFAQRWALTLKRWIIFFINYENQSVFSIWKHHKCLTQLSLIHLNTYVMGLRPLEIFLLLQRGDRLQSSESDVYRRQILTTKVDPRAVRVKGLCTRRCAFIIAFSAACLVPRWTATLSLLR